MKKVKPIFIIHNYLNNLSINESATATETEQFIHAYIDYMFDLKGINKDNFCVQICKVSKKELGDFSAKMDKEGDTYHIFLNEELLTVRSHSSFCNVFDLAINAGHETQHIFQYIFSPKLMKKYDDFLSELEDSTSRLYNTKYAYREIKPLIKRMLALQNLNCSISSIERNAVYRGNQYLQSLLNELTNMDNSEKLRELIIFFQLLLQDNIIEDNKFDAQSFKKADEIINQLSASNRISQNIIKIF